MSNVDFPGITKQARGIAKLYKWLGLYSIPVLTIVTIISISNMFSRGQLASSSVLDVIWIAVFATAIEVNIVRLFFEWKLEHDRGALWLGIGLVFVAGVALLMEGLQQSIGFAWSNYYVQYAVGFVVALRVFVVVLLLAREGSKLASALSDSEQSMYACLVDFSEQESIQEVFTNSEQEPITESIQVVSTSDNVLVFTGKQLTPAAKRVQKVLKTNPDASLSVIAEKAHVSRGYASQIRSKVQSKQIEKEA